MIKIAICDDDKYMTEKLRAKIDKLLCFTSAEYIIFVFNSAYDFENSEIETYDIVLLDIEINDDNGIDIANRFRKKNLEAILIFVSQFIEYAPEGYTVNAFRYILKSSLEKIFDKEFKNALKALDKSKKYFDFKINKESMSIDLAKVIYFESVKNKIIIRSNIKEDGIYEFYDKLDNIQKTVEENGFLRVQ